MELSKLGSYITPSDARNSDGIYSEDAVVGLSTQKELIETKADLTDVNLKKYKLMPPNFFAYIPDTSRRGDKMSLAYNRTDKTFLVSAISVVFSVTSEEKLLSDYLFMYFNRPEFDRYARFNSWGSARETFTWGEMCDIDISLPPLSVQQKYVDIYNALRSNQQAYERGLDDLKLTCDAYIENLRKNMKCEEIRRYIERGKKNTNEEITEVLGIGKNGFMQPQKDPNASLKNYKILEKDVICYAPPLYNVLTGALHLYEEEEKAVCSPIYEVFYCDKKHLLPEYLVLWLKREEFKRYAEFFASGVRGTFDFSLMCEVKIPIPPIEVQQSIARVYRAYTRRKQINELLKAQLKAVCPVLIKGSVEEA